MLLIKKEIILLLLFFSFISSETEENNSFNIPLKQVGRLFLIEATVDGQRGNFVFDTGAVGLVLNKTYYRNAVSTSQSAGISGTSISSGTLKVKEMSIGDIQIRHINADVANLGNIENKRHVRILGLIGMDILKGYEMIVDVRQHNLKLIRIDRRGNYADDVDFSFQADLESRVVLRNGIMFLRGEIAGKKMDFCLDTGAESNVLCSSCRKDILSSVSISRKTELTGMGGRTVEVLYGAMTDFTLNEVQFSPMQTIVTSLAALSAAYDFPVDGVLGYDFFARGKIRINLVKNELGIIFYQ